MNYTREFPIEPQVSCLLVIDVQNFAYELVKSVASDTPSTESEIDENFFRRELDSSVLPNITGLLSTCREAGIEVIYTVIESLTEDGRDRSLDYKISGFHVPKGTHGAKVINSVAPVNDEIVLGKTSSNPFVSTNIDYLLRNLGVQNLIVCGLFTDQCVESAVRSACDLGYRVCLAEDACLSYKISAHNRSLESMSGYCIQRSTNEIVQEICNKVAIEQSL